MRGAIVLALVTACGGVAATAAPIEDAAPPPATDAGEPEADAASSPAVADAGARDEDATATPAATCGPSPFSQLRCFGHPDAGNGTSHPTACDASTDGCYVDGAIWCCPQ